jgi:hypothetical protein
VEIALYLRIETFADAVGDKDTARLAKQIRREEERMAKYLTAELGRLVKEIVRVEVPRDQRAKPPTRSRRRTGTSRSGAASSRSAGSSSGRSGASGSRSRSGSSRSSSNGSSSTGTRSRPTGTRSRTPSAA